MTFAIQSLAAVTYVATGLLRDSKGNFAIPFVAHTKAANRVEATANIVQAAPRGAYIQSVTVLA